MNWTDKEFQALQKQCVEQLEEIREIRSWEKSWMIVLEAKDKHHAALVSAAIEVVRVYGEHPSSGTLQALSRALCDLKEDDDNLPPPTIAEVLEEKHNP